MTLAQLKRSIRVGQKWQCYNHLTNTNMGVRPVSRVQGNAITFRMANGEDSWLHWPRSRDMWVSHDCSTFEIRNLGGQPVLTYRLEMPNKDQENENEDVDRA